MSDRGRSHSDIHMNAAERQHSASLMFSSDIEAIFGLSVTLTIHSLSPTPSLKAHIT